MELIGEVDFYTVERSFVMLFMRIVCYYSYIFLLFLYKTEKSMELKYEESRKIDVLPYIVGCVALLFLASLFRTSMINGSTLTNHESCKCYYCKMKNLLGVYYVNIFG